MSLYDIKRGYRTLNCFRGTAAGTTACTAIVASATGVQHICHYFVISATTGGHVSFKSGATEIGPTLHFSGSGGVELHTPYITAATGIALNIEIDCAGSNTYYGYYTTT